MPWITTKPMDQKLLFVADYLRNVTSFSALCDQYHISRKTGYKWVKRYREGSLDALSDRSRRPHKHPLRTPVAVRNAIVELRSRGPYEQPGPKKIQALLREHHPDWDIPSCTTIYKILCAHDLVKKQRRRRSTPPYARPFDPVRHPNDLWSADFKGQFKTRNGSMCYPLTVMDHQSRFLLGCRIFEGTRLEQTKEAFELLFREYGLPWRIRTDNGVPFASRSAGGLSHLSMWWVRLGILPERIEPGQPQQNGRHERMHRTLKAATTLPPESTPKRQQQRFDAYRTHYNFERPHESLAQQTPGSVYVVSPRQMPDRLPELVYPSHFHVALVQHNGVVHHRGNRIYVSGLLKGERVGIEEIDDGVWEVSFGFVRLGSFDMQVTKAGQNEYIRMQV